MKYIKNSQEYTVVPDKYEQTFIRDNFAPVNRNIVMMLKQNGTIDNDDIKICEFLYRTGFATIEQIIRFCDFAGIIEPVNRVKVLCLNMILSDFVLTDDEKYKGKFPPDIKYFYCLQEGGRYLLEHYSDLAFVEWEQSYNCKGSKNVGKAIILTEVYLEMLTTKKDRLMYYTKYPLYIFKKYSLLGGAVYGLSTNEKPIYTALDVFRRYESLDGIREKIKRYESLLSTNIWRHYYPDGKEAPTLIIVTDNDETALAMARELSITKIPSYLLTTDTRLLKGIMEMGTFLAYNVEEDYLYETSYFDF